MSPGKDRRTIPATVCRVLLCCFLPVLAVAQSYVDPDGTDTEPPNDRFYVQTEGDIRVTTAVPSAAETRELFGYGLYALDVQPVWVRVENLSDETLWFLPAGIDDAYLTPVEAIYRRLGGRSLTDWALHRDYVDRQMTFAIEAHGLRAGYVFTTIDEGTKSFNVDVISLTKQARMTFSVPVPGLRLDHYEVDWDSLYEPDTIREVGQAELISGLEAFACCVTGEGGETNGDPLNIVIVGDRQDLYYAFTRAGWDETETVYSASLWKTMVSALFHNRYRYSPVSALYFDGRVQDVALQKSRDSIHQRNHLRLWMTSMRYEGKPVWMGQISRDIGVRLTKKTVTTHKIDPDVDDAREFLLEDIAYAQSLEAFGYVGGVGRATIDSPRPNYTGDPYFTDGLRVVLFVSSESVDIAEIRKINLGKHPVDFLVQEE